jgi:hypothetical protein
MEKRYQVFVSSTYKDLREERQEVMQTLLESNCIPTSMELFPAADEDSWTVIKKHISECDYYIVIIGGKYGSVAANGISYTEKEYDYAVEAGLPVLAFLHQHPEDLLAKNTEDEKDRRDALGKFRLKIEGRKHCKYWTSREHLGGLVSRSIATIKNTNPRVGWVRANLVADESAAQEIVRLRHQIDELQGRLSAVQQPQGTETLAQGEETISLTFQFDTKHSHFVEQRYPYTWNKLLSLLGPVLLKPATERHLKETLEIALAHEVSDEGGSIRDVHIRDKDFQTIKIQFRALQLITQVTVADDLRWMLTQYGDTVMTKIAAIRSRKLPGSP